MAQSFRPEVLGQWSGPVPFAVSRERMIAYAEATNDPVRQHRDGSVAAPVFAVVPVFPIMADTVLSAVPDDLMMKLLHGRHDFHFRRPIVAGDELTSRGKVLGIHAKSSGVVVTSLLETRDWNGDVVNEQFFTGFFRGAVVEASIGEDAPDHRAPEGLTATEPLGRVVQAYDDDQTFRYSAASGDPMPIHLDDDFAKMMGLPGIIVHGMCTAAFASHALIGRAAPEDPSRLRRLAVRFSAPALPRHTITTSIWESGEGAFVFETVTDEGSAVIRDGLAVFS